MTKKTDREKLAAYEQKLNEWAHWGVATVDLDPTRGHVAGLVRMLLTSVDDEAVAKGYQQAILDLGSKMQGDKDQWDRLHTP